MRKRIKDPRYTAAVISPHHLASVCQAAEERGIDPAPWFAGLGLDRAQINDPKLRVSYRQASTLIRRALQAMPEQGLGLEIGRRENASALGAVGLAMMTSRTLGEAIQLFLENHLQAGTLMDPAIEARGKALALVASPRFPDEDLLPFLCEEYFSAALAVARSLVGGDFRPSAMELSYPPPSYADAYREMAQCEVRFGMPRNQAFFDMQWLTCPLPTHHPVTAREARAALSPQPEQVRDVVAMVEGWLRERLRGQPKLADAAASLHMTERNLRRKLTEAGTGYQEIHDRMRKARALELLRKDALSVAEIGAEVGFRDAREFRRAFKRWTGKPPVALRGRR